jgi:hypothetical protein
MARLYPVIHYHSLRLALRNTEVAVGADCAGVFIIDTLGRTGTLWPAAEAIRREFPTLWLGVNRLDLDAATCARAVAGAGSLFNGVWTDDAGLNTDGRDRAERSALDLAMQAWRRARPDARCFAAAAFEYGRPELNPAGAATAAVRLGCTPTTSCSETSVAASAEKLAVMSDAAWRLGGRLAVASGITTENARSLAPFMDDALCATGVSRDDVTLDAGKVRALRAILTEAAEDDRDAGRAAGAA